MASNLDKLLRDHSDPVRAESMRWYMKYQFAYYGLDSQSRRALSRQFFKRTGDPLPEELPSLLEDLWQYDEREMQYVGIDLVRRLVKKQPIQFIEILEHLIQTKSWWDTVDALSVDAGTLFLQFPDLQPRKTNQWISSENFWLQRAAILHQLKYKSLTDWPMLQRYILQVCHDKQFFIRKACGWALREYSKINREAVRLFIDRNRDKLSGLTVREGSKYV